jgi:uncharacterized membrane protein
MRNFYHAEAFSSGWVATGPQQADTSNAARNAMSNNAPNEASRIDDVQAVIRRVEAGTLSDTERDLILQQLESAPVSETAVLAALVRQSFSGPLPPPALFAQYDEATRRAILEMAQREQTHTHEMQRTGLDGAIAKDRRGQWIGGGIAVSGLIAAAVIAPYSTVAAGIIGTLDLFGMVALFVAPRLLERRHVQNTSELDE